MIDNLISYNCLMIHGNIFMIFSIHHHVCVCHRRLPINVVDMVFVSINAVKPSFIQINPLPCKWMEVISVHDFSPPPAHFSRTRCTRAAFLFRNTYYSVVLE